MSENYFESKKSKDKVEFMLGEYDCPDLLKEQSDAKALDEFIDDYNWGDGLEIPYFILRHRNCELGTALKIFYSGEGALMLEENYKNYQLGHWVEFAEYTFKRIVERNYSSKLIAFKFPLKEDFKRSIKEAGWPDIFIENIVV